MVSSIIYIADICEKHCKKVRLFHKIVGSITNEVRYIKYFIEHIVDFDAKRSENDFIVRTNVDSHLNNRKLILNPSLNPAILFKFIRHIIISFNHYMI